ncbi:MAG TPA: LCP family protein [Solirubrobacteraceae bacterium]|nr:LCP family protein [Solirubrobacteraceae bacterium]
MSLFPTSRRGALLRFALGAVIVVAFAAATTAVAGLLQFKQFTAELDRTPALKHASVTIADPGNPQTLLLIGSDHRAGEPWSSANTDTMMLVRLDPVSLTINVLSIPRDLEVQLPQGGAVGPAKLNAAYSIGGPGLLIKTLQDQVFPSLHVNHIIDVNFGGFAALVDTVGCVYVDVDHRYYNNTAVTNYSSIDIQPGYQRLCGSDALAFVRFRHTDTDIVRNARQQDFLRWVKDEFGTSYLISNRDRLLGIFGAHTQTDADLHSIDGLINLFNLVAFSAGHTVKQVPFPAILQPCDPNGKIPCYVSADAGAEQQAFQRFMTPTLQQPAGGGGAGGRAAGKPGGGQGGGSADLTADPAGGQAQSGALRGAGMPVYYPRVLASGSSYCSGASGNCPTEIPSSESYPRAYQIRDINGTMHPAYHMTLELNPNLGQYYGVQGTTWTDPPILKGTKQTGTVGGKQLLEYFNGHKLSLVAWRTPGAVYWISNTLTDDLTNRQMVAIAASLSPLGPATRSASGLA